MTSVSRTAQFAKVQKVLKKYYKPVAREADRPVLDHLLFACCLEDAHYEAAEEAFAALVHTFFDWNEVRVTSIAELAEVMANLPDPRAAANRVKRVLHSVFEATYSFELEDRRKKNLGPTIKWLEKLDGTTRFSVACVVQAALSGHAIPIDTGTMRVLRLLDLVTEKDAAAGVVPGLERAVSKSKGVEFGSLLHQLGADFTANPYAPTVREILLQINPDVQQRLPKRRADRESKKPPATAAAEAPPPAGPTPQAATRPKKKAAEPDTAGGPVQAAATTEKAAAARKRPPADAKKTSRPVPQSGDTQETAADADAPKKKSASSGLAKRKPR
jgi:endonuclease-3